MKFSQEKRWRFPKSRRRTREFAKSWMIWIYVIPSTSLNLGQLKDLKCSWRPLMRRLLPTNNSLINKKYYFGLITFHEWSLRKLYARSLWWVIRAAEAYESQSFLHPVRLSISLSCILFFAWASVESCCTCAPCKNESQLLLILMMAVSIRLLSV